jgi:hypothetical protein
VLRTVFLLLGIGLLGVLLWRLGPSQILELLGRIGWYAIPVIFLYAAHHAVRAFALHTCVLRRGLLRYGDALAIRLSGEAVQSLTFTGPLLAEPTRAWLLQRYGLTLKEGFAATITEYLICAFVTAGMSIVGLLYLVSHFEPRAAVAGIAVAIVCVFSAFLIASAIAIRRRFYLIGTIIAALARIGVLRGRLRPDMTWINRMEDLLLALLRDRPARLAGVAVIEVAAQALLVFELFWLLYALDVAAPRSYPFVIEASTKVIGIAFLFVPLQVGVSEGAYVLVFEILGLSAAAGFALAFLRRMRSVVVAGVGLATLALLTRDRRRALA